jgi:hypothetical protein
MSIQAVQARGLEQVAPPARGAGGTDAAQTTRPEEQAGPAQARDEVIVSDQARQLSSTAGSGAKGEVELKLDFRELRALVTGKSNGPS